MQPPDGTQTARAAGWCSPAGAAAYEDTLSSPGTVRGKGTRSQFSHWGRGGCCWHHVAANATCSSQLRRAPRTRRQGEGSRAVRQTAPPPRTRSPLTQQKETVRLLVLPLFGFQHLIDPFAPLAVRLLLDFEVARLADSRGRALAARIRRFAVSSSAVGRERQVVSPGSEAVTHSHAGGQASTGHLLAETRSRGGALRRRKDTCPKRVRGTPIGWSALPLLHPCKRARPGRSSLVWTLLGLKLLVHSPDRF